MPRPSIGPLVLIAALAAPPASAHPHVFISAGAELLYRDDGAILGLRYTWTFDDMFSAYALQGVEQKTRGAYTRSELDHLAKLNVDALAEFRYFTFARSADEPAAANAPFAEPRDYYFDYIDGSLVLHFTLPFAAAMRARSMLVEIYDPTYFVAMVLEDTDPVRLVGAPAACAISLHRPADGPATARALGEAAFAGNANAGLGHMFANTLTVTCP